MSPLSPSRQRAPLTEIKSLAIAPCSSVRSIHRRDESRQLYRCRPQKNKGLPNAQNCEPGAAGVTAVTARSPGACSTACSKEALHFEGIAGTSAGAVDAGVLADGLAAGGREGVRDGITA